MVHIPVPDLFIPDEIQAIIMYSCIQVRPAGLHDIDRITLFPQFDKDGLYNVFRLFIILQDGKGVPVQSLIAGMKELPEQVFR